jgi:hypothetical protein
MLLNKSNKYFDEDGDDDDYSVIIHATDATTREKSDTLDSSIYDSIDETFI